MTRVVALTMVLALVGCSSGESPSAESQSSLPGPATAELAVVDLFDALGEGDFAGAAELTVDGQMVLVALVEGVSLDEALVIYDSGDLEVGANFWQAFAESLSQQVSEGSAGVVIDTVERFTVGERDFARVGVVFRDSGGSRTVVVQHGLGWEIDVLATFASALAGKLAPLADLLRGNPKAEPLRVLLNDQVPSLEAVLTDEDIGAVLQQAAVAAIESIRR